MSDSPLDLDLKLMPDWLKEPADKNPYADFEGEVADHPYRRDPGRGPRPGGGQRGDRGPRPGGGNRPGGGQNRGGQGRPGGNRDARGPGGPGPRGPQREGGGGQGHSAHGRDNRDNRGSGGPRGDRRDQGRGGQFQRGPRREEGQQHHEEAPINVNVEFLPEANGVAALAKQIRGGHRAYPLYGLGRMFLNKPERHRVRITSADPNVTLYQIGTDGPVTSHRVAAEREAFRTLKSQYYAEEVTQIDPPKGNFANVGRCRVTGTLLGPTNHHGYQPALRRLYEARFSRRMSFNEFLRGIEVVTDPAAIEAWKQEASSVTLYKTTQEAEAKEFKSQAEVEAHFKATYLEKVIRADKTLEMNGAASREVNDRGIRNAIRTAWEKERAFPAQIVNRIRPHFLEAGLHIWKHRKRILFVSTVRPVRFPNNAQNVSAHIADILRTIEESPKCTRADLSTKLLKPHEADPEFQKLKAALAADLHWLIISGHVIEFHDGTLDLPLPPKELAKESAREESPDAHAEVQEAANAAAAAGVSATAEETSNEVPTDGAETPVEASADTHEASAQVESHREESPAAQVDATAQAEATAAAVVSGESAAESSTAHEEPKQVEAEAAVHQPDTGSSAE